MAREHAGNRRSFQPTLVAGRLESRLLLSRNGIPSPKPYITGYTVDRGRADILILPTGETFKVKVSDSPFTSSGGPTIRFRPYHGQVDLFIYGSTTNTSLDINPQPHPANERLPKHDRGSYYIRQHEFPLGTIKQTGILPIHSIYIATGKLNSIYGYRTADLYGSIVASATTPIERIALADVQPGGSISVGGDLNILSVFNNATFSNGGSLAVGRDLNWMNIGGSLNIGAGSAVGVTRDIGFSNSGPNGSDPGGQGGVVGGNLNIVPGGQFIVGRSLDGPFTINGAVTGATGIVFLAGANHGQSNLNSKGGFTP